MYSVDWARLLKRKIKNCIFYRKYCFHSNITKSKHVFVTRNLAGKVTALEDIRMLFDMLTDTKILDRDEAAAISETEVVAGLIHKLIEENAHAIIDPDDYDRRYNKLMARYDAAKEQLVSSEAQRSALKARKRDMAAFCRVLKETEPLVEFDEDVWNVAVGNVIIRSGGHFAFSFHAE